LKHVRNIKIQARSGQLYYAAFQASSAFGSGEAFYVPIATSPYVAVPIQVAFNLGFGFIEKGSALGKLQQCRYEKPLPTANE
ncbi:MAG: hypothetical protein ABW168_26100, partial [Sedimenticola sp.]